MKKRFNTNRLLLVALIGLGLGAVLILIVGIYMKVIGFGMPDVLWVRQHELKYCPRCGLQRWEHSAGFFFGLSSGHIEAKPAGNSSGIVDRAKCDHFFFTIASDDMLFTRDFKLNRHKLGQPDGDAFWDQPVLVEAFRTMEKEDRRYAFMIFRLLAGDKQRGTLSSNVVEAAMGTNSQAVIDSLNQTFTNKHGPYVR